MGNRTCSIEGCEKASRARGWCATHWKRWQRHGDPLAVGKPGAPRADSLTYHGAHTRVQRERGPADQQPCADCGGEAQEWSYVPGSPREVVGHSPKRGRLFKVAYSPDPADYQPRCRPCHRAFDAVA